MSKLGSATSLAEVIREAIFDTLDDVHRCMPCKVVTYDAEAQTVSVKPLLKTSSEDANGDQVARSIPTIFGVPVAFPNGGGFAVTWPLVAGDLGFCFFADLSLSAWKAGDGSEVDPADVRTGHLQDAVFYPAARPSGNVLADVPTDALRLGKVGGAAVRIEDDAIKLDADGDESAETPVAKEGSAVIGFAGPYPVTANVQVGAGSQKVKVP